MNWLTRSWDRVRELIMPSRDKLVVQYFEGVLPVELDWINARRKDQGRDDPVKRLPYREPPGPGPEAALRVPRSHFAQPESEISRRPSRTRSPDPDVLFPVPPAAGGPATLRGERRVRRPSDRAGIADPADPLSDKMRPQPVPCTATGLSLSGGGIRSAAVCLGAIQALAGKGRLAAIDYLSSVSGGGYIGACLSAAMTGPDGNFPFGTDILDSHAVAHLRNYSNYLMPRGRSGARNAAEAAVIVLRGLVANAVIATTMIAAAALITFALGVGLSLLPILNPLAWHPPAGSAFALKALTSPSAPLAPALLVGTALALLLIAWAIRRSMPSQLNPSDTHGPFLTSARVLLLVGLAALFIGLQPPLIELVQDVHVEGLAHSQIADPLAKAWGVLTALTGVIASVSGPIGRFLEASSRTKKKSTIALRLATRTAVLVAACVLPLTLWLLYLCLSAALIHGWPAPAWAQYGSNFLPWRRLADVPPYLPLASAIFVLGMIVSTLLGANGYSLHRFYRDRLSRAFLFRADRGPEPLLLDSIRLSELKRSHGPYHIINAALNVQASAEANRRGRNADFFIFTPHFVGSDLTMYSSTDRRKFRGYAPTVGMEAIDRRLDLATAVAISGAAVSANMGSSTIRVLSPTLALLNIRLGYWLANPRVLATRARVRASIGNLLRNFREKFYLFVEMLNLHDETSPVVFLSDGGHIENLGIYELLKRGCQTIIAIDAEADPDLAFPSLLKLERYARIDLGVRISLPWEEIASTSNRVRQARANGARRVRNGPHCAVGRIYYPEGRIGNLVYFKSSITGDEKDYVLDYQRRNPAFPHETTGDQFFGEEQFEMYRALGFHMVNGFLTRRDRFAYCRDGDHPFADEDSAFDEVMATIPECVPAGY